MARSLQPTRGELRVLAARLRTGTNADAARALDISERTVKNVIGHLNTKLDTRNAIEAAAVLGWLRIPEDI